MRSWKHRCTASYALSLRHAIADQRVVFPCRSARAKLGAFQAWNSCLVHILSLADAHIESVMVEAFVRAVEDCMDPECKKSLKVRSVALSGC